MKLELTNLYLKVAAALFLVSLLAAIWGVIVWPVDNSAERLTWSAAWVALISGLVLHVIGRVAQARTRRG